MTAVSSHAVNPVGGPSAPDPDLSPWSVEFAEPPPPTSYPLPPTSHPPPPTSHLPPPTAYHPSHVPPPASAPPPTAPPRPPPAQQPPPRLPDHAPPASSDTVAKLKSFIKQNLRGSSGDSFLSSSDDNLSEDRDASHCSSPSVMYEHLIPGGAGTSGEGTSAPEPKPLTTSNVTLHDQIWSSDLGSSSRNSDEKCRKLLRSSNEDLASSSDLVSANRKPRTYFDSGSERSCDYSCDSSQETMILTVTDNQSHTYAFHNWRVTLDSRREEEDASGESHLDEIGETMPDCIPIRRGTAPPEYKVSTTVVLLPFEFDFTHVSSLVKNRISLGSPGFRRGHF